MATKSFYNKQQYKTTQSYIYFLVYYLFCKFYLAKSIMHTMALLRQCYACVSFVQNLNIKHGCQELNFLFVGTILTILWVLLSLSEGVGVNFDLSKTGYHIYHLLNLII